MHFFVLTPAFWEFNAVILQQILKHMLNFLSLWAGIEAPSYLETQTECNVCGSKSEGIRVLPTKTSFWYMYEDSQRDMNDYDKIMESIDNTKGLILGLIWDIIKLIFFGALAIELICN